MPDDDKQLKTPPIQLQERRITLEDGRYMVFFTFTDDEGRDLSEGLHPWDSNERTTPLLSATPRGDAPAGTPEKEGS